MPWWVTRWESNAILAAAARAGALLAAAGCRVLHAFARFVREGRGTPAPIAPTERLVVGGVYRHVRNPMYVAVLAAILGQGLLLGQLLLVGYGRRGGSWWPFVRLYEEPVLAERFGDDYDAYRRAVPAWLPSLRPWRPRPSNDPS